MEVRKLKEIGFTIDEVLEKLGITQEYVNISLCNELDEKGEEKLFGKPIKLEVIVKDE